MNKRGFSANEILAIRYILLALIPLIYCIISGRIYVATTVDYSMSLFISFFSLIIPLYFSQNSIEHIGYIEHSTLIGITPFCVFVLQLFYLHDKYITYEGIFSFILTILITLLFYKSYNKSKRGLITHST